MTGSKRRRSDLARQIEDTRATYVRSRNILAGFALLCGAALLLAGEPAAGAALAAFAGVQLFAPRVRPAAIRIPAEVRRLRR